MNNMLSQKWRRGWDGMMICWEMYTLSVSLDLFLLYKIFNKWNMDTHIIYHKMHLCAIFLRSIFLLRKKAIWCSKANIWKSFILQFWRYIGVYMWRSYGILSYFSCFMGIKYAFLKWTAVKVLNWSLEESILIKI